MGPSAMRILGIDCGTERTGYGVIDSDGSDHQLVLAGVIEPLHGRGLELRLLEIAEKLREVIRRETPDSAAVEGVFYAVNVKTALKLSHARGVALLVVAEAGLELGEYSPLEVKLSVVGHGRATKQQVQMMIHSLLRLETAIESEDACDALAVAVCHATHVQMKKRLQRGAS